jgi:hypothetical protein
VLAGNNVSPAVRAKLKRMQDLHAKALGGKKVDEEALQEGAALAAELMPVLNFRVDDVDWD